jgi:hypothetical protein
MRRKQSPSPPRVRPGAESPFDIIPFPCLRCGRLGVAVPVFSFLLGASEQTFACRLCRENVEHYVGVSRQNGAISIAYERHTRRYPLEAYDEGLPLTVVAMHARRPQTVKPECDASFGPIMVSPRKRRFTRPEVRQLWSASRGRCHICQRRWGLSQRGRAGWHIDHVIPHIGGGADTEALQNFRVACASCNLKKGRGYTPTSVDRCIRMLREYLDARPAHRAKSPPNRS